MEVAYAEKMTKLNRELIAKYVSCATFAYLSGSHGNDHLTIIN